MELPSNDEYPELGSLLPKNIKGTSNKIPVSKKKSWVKMDMTPDDDTTTDHGSMDQRTRAFDKLSNKTELSQSLYKTRMCFSVASGDKCPHGETCRFAHSKSELVLAKCFFGDRCQFVRNGRNGKWYNCGGKKCKHIHPDESRENFMNRMGFCQDEPKRVAEDEDEDVDEGVAKGVAEGVAEGVAKGVAKGGLEPKLIQLQNLNQVLAPSSVPETVLKVPRFMATQAIELALQSGTNVRVVVVD